MNGRGDDGQNHTGPEDPRFNENEKILSHSAILRFGRELDEFSTHRTKYQDRKSEREDLASRANSGARTDCAARANLTVRHRFQP
jgi:hypothetical protein